jgi:hypothetical protein
MACASPCEKCDAPRSVGTCTPKPPGPDADGECLDAGCDGAGNCVSSGGCFGLLRAGGGLDDNGYRVALDAAGNAYVSGYGQVDLGCGAMTSASGFVAKLDPSLACVWHAKKAARGKLALDASGNLFVASATKTSSDFGCGVAPNAGSDDVSIAKLDAMGNCLWHKVTGDAQSQTVTGVAVDAMGNVWLGGYGGGGSMDLGCGPISNGVNQFSSFVVKLDGAGACLWQAQVPNQFVDDVALDSAGNLLTTGSANGTGAFVEKRDPAGTLIWRTSAGVSPHHVLLPTVSVDATGSTIVAGRFTGTLDFGSCAPLAVPPQGPNRGFVAKLDSSGACTWLRGASETQSFAHFDPANVAFDSQGNALIAGAFAGSIDMGCGALQMPSGPLGTDGTDSVVFKVDPSGNCIWQARGGDTIRSWADGVAVSSAGVVHVIGAFTNKISFGCASVSTGTSDVTDLYLARLAL